MHFSTAMQSKKKTRTTKRVFMIQKPCINYYQYTPIKIKSQADMRDN